PVTIATLPSSRIAHPSKDRWDVTWSGLADARAIQDLCDFVENCRVVDRRRHPPGLAVGNLAHGAPKDLSRPRLWQSRHGHGKPEGRDRAYLLAHQVYALPFHFSGAALDTGTQHQ